MAADESAYTALSEEGDDHRWAYGTGFDDPLSGVDTTLPDGVDGNDLAEYCLMLGDDALVLSHRLQEWVTRAPELEEETALANIALDLLGQARVLLCRAGSADGTGRGEDDYAFAREPAAFRHVGLVAGADADFGGLIARLVVFSIWRLALLSRLRESRDPVLAAIGGKGVKEVTYHREYAALWAVRLGDGTAYSRVRMREGLAAVAPFVAELFVASDLEERLASAGVAPHLDEVRAEFDDVLDQVLMAAGLDRPVFTPGAVAGRIGLHRPESEALIAELQSVARALPGATW